MKLLVVGGVAAGASIAARARRLDDSAEIIVFERGHHVSFANCGLPYHVGEVISERSRLLLQTPESLKESLNLDVRLGHEVLSIDRKAQTVRVRIVDSGEEFTESYDALALAPGAEPLRLPIPGTELPGVFVLRRIGDMDQIKALVDSELAAFEAGTRGPVTATVIGAGYVGLELAENLQHRGVRTTVVELADQILPPLDKEMAVPVEEHLRSRGVALELSAAAAAITKSASAKEAPLRVELTTGSSLASDLVIMSAGVRPSTALAVDAGLELGAHGGIAVDEHMRTSDPKIWAAGDAVETPNTVLPGSYLAPLAGPANRQGRVAAENICGRTTVYKSTQGTSVVKVFDMTAGGTGATERQLLAMQVPYTAIHVHPSGHAGYYPGTAMMHLKVLFSPETGKLLGAQVAGYDGVDKRIDVLATAIRFERTVDDLQELELAYAPPFGSAKDPINMAGFVGSNVRQGDLHLWYADDFPVETANTRIVDVRTAEEFDIWHIPGAENAPLATIRELTEDWDRATPIRLYCAVGFRSYLAYRALVQRGFTDVATLSGGSTTFKFHHELDAHEVPAPVENYAELESVVRNLPQASGLITSLDCTGLACPGPIMKLSEQMKQLAIGDEVEVRVSDAGFASDGPAWAKRNGHQLVEIAPEGAGYVAKFRKGGPGALAASQAVVGSASARPKNSFIVFSGDLDKQLAAFIISNGALAMGEEVSLFFTFWGLNALRKSKPPKRQRKVMDRMFGAMMPSDANHLPLSQMNMMGAGAAMIKKVMHDHSVQSLPELIAAAQSSGARLIACTMTMDLLGIAESDLIDGVEFGGVATFLGEAAESHNTLFI